MMIGFLPGTAPGKMSGHARLIVALQACWQADPADASVDAICRMAGVPDPSRYRAFGSERTFAKSPASCRARREGQGRDRRPYSAGQRKDHAPIGGITAAKVVENAARRAGGPKRPNNIRKLAEGVWSQC